MTTSQELDRAQERADKTAADLRRTEAELRVTRVSKPNKMHPNVCLVLFCFVVNLFVQKVAVPLREIIQYDLRNSKNHATKLIKLKFHTV